MDVCLWGVWWFYAVYGWLFDYCRVVGLDGYVVLWWMFGLGWFWVFVDFVLDVYRVCVWLMFELWSWQCVGVWWFLLRCFVCLVVLGSGFVVWMDLVGVGCSFGVDCCLVVICGLIVGVLYALMRFFCDLLMV